MKIIWFVALCMSSGASAESCFDTLVGHPAIAQTQRFGLGSDATKHEVARWDTDVRPDGQGLPPGSGTVMRGADVYAAQCAHCHGDQGQGIAIYDRLVGETIRDLGEAREALGQRTIGNYWPYATTIFDYVKRAMPWESPGSLSDDDVYAVTAMLLFANGLIGTDAVMDARTLPEVEMRSTDTFVYDDRCGGPGIR